jgi:hypothetical protein
METPYRKALRSYVRTYSLLKSGRLGTNIELTLYKALIRSVMIYACPTWDYTAYAHRLKLQRLQNEYSALLDTLTVARQFANCMWISKFLTCKTT